MTTEYAHDIVVFYSENERENALAFCRRVRLICLENGRHPDIVTMDEIAHPGKQDIANLDDGLENGRYIFFSHKYYTEDRFGAFAGNVAMSSALPDRFVRLNIGDIQASGEFHSFDSYFRSALALNVDWGFKTKTEARIKRMLAGIANSASSDHLIVENPSITSLSLESAATPSSVEMTQPNTNAAFPDIPEQQQQQLEDDDIMEDGQGSFQFGANAESLEARQSLPVARVPPITRHVTPEVTSSSTARSSPDGAQGISSSNFEAARTSGMPQSANNSSDSFWTEDLVSDLL